MGAASFSTTHKRARLKSGRRPRDREESDMNGQMDQPRGLMPEGGAEQPASSPAPQEGGDETANVSPEEQAKYDQFVNNGLELIYTEKSFTKVVEALKVGNDPIDAVVNATVNIVQRLQDSAKQKKIGRAHG